MDMMDDACDPTPPVQRAASGIVCTSIFNTVQAINHQVEALDDYREDARKLYRYLRRAEVLVSDIKPFIEAQPTQPSLRALAAIEDVMLRVHQDMENCRAKGKLTALVQGDRVLKSFKQAACELEAAIGKLPLAELGAADETVQEFESLRTILQGTKFEMPPEQAALVQEYRSACAALKSPLQQLQDSCRAVISAVAGDSYLTRDQFAGVVADLQREVRLVKHSGGDCGSDGCSEDELQLRMMMDMLRLMHAKEGAPMEFVCPITTQVMVDPVLLHETGHSYEREAICGWWAQGKRFCPKSGVPLKGKVLKVTPNASLKAAIKRWHEDCDLQLSFKPLMHTMSSGGVDVRALYPPSAPQRTSSGLEQRMSLEGGPLPVSTSGSGMSSDASSDDVLPGGADAAPLPVGSGYGHSADKGTHRRLFGMGPVSAGSQ